MMRNILRLNCVILLIFIAINCFAGHTSINSIFSIALPDNMKLAWQNKDTEKSIYQFVFQSSPFGDYSPQQIRITAVGQAPSNNTEYSDWETNALGANIAMFAMSYHLDLSKQGDVLAKKPEKMKLGNQMFTASMMTNDDMQVYFLVTTIKHSTYNITLVSIDKNSQIRKLKMQRLLDAIKSIEFFGAKKSS